MIRADIHDRLNYAAKEARCSPELAVKKILNNSIPSDIKRQNEVYVSRYGVKVSCEEMLSGKAPLNTHFASFLKISVDRRTMRKIKSLCKATGLPLFWIVEAIIGGSEDEQIIETINKPPGWKKPINKLKEVCRLVLQEQFLNEVLDFLRDLLNSLGNFMPRDSRA